MASNSRLSPKVDFTKDSPVKSYMYGNSSLPDISPNSVDLNRSQEYSSSNLSVANGIDVPNKKLRDARKHGRNANHRKIANKDGTAMFNALMQNKTSEIQMSLIQNRIRRLEYEEHRARNKIQKARDRADRLQKIREHKSQQRQEKQKHKELQQRRLSSVRKSNTIERIRMRQHIRDLRDFQKSNYNSLLIF